MNNDTFLLLFISFIAIMGITPLAFRKIKVPGVIALLIVGMIIGPNGLDLIGIITQGAKFLGGDQKACYDYFTTFVGSLGSLGLVFLMAQAGMEADFKMIREAKKPVIMLSILTFLLPAISGFFIYQYFRSDDFAGKLLYASLFASHSVGIVFPVIRELKLTKSRFGAAVLISTVITDIASIILLAVSVQIKKMGSSEAAEAAKKTLSIFDYIDANIFGSYFTVVFLLIVLVYLALSVFLVSQFGKWMLKSFRPSEEAMVPVVLLIIMITVLVGEFLGINMVVGAFIAGLALARLVKHTEGEIPLLARFESIGYGLLIPFLFISIGMNSNFRAFSQVENIYIILFTVVGLIVSKIGSGWIAMRLSGFGNRQGLCAGLMTVPQLSATLAAAAVGKDLGMLDDNFFNAIIILSIVTTIPIPTLVRLIIERSGVKFTEEKDFPVPKVVKQDDLL
ncbi:MAG: cation:proton antiporter [Lentisphaeria bacterium]|nr:cation:proton antiporter [Lentisphaeria bacterium]